MKDIHTKEDELEIQIIGLQGKIERLEKQLKEQRAEFLVDLVDLYFETDPCLYFKESKLEFALTKQKWESK